VIEAAGFADVRFSAQRWDAFGGSPSESSAYKFGTEGVAIWARKPGGPCKETQRGGTTVSTLSRDPLPAPDSVLEAFGDGCATLTPRIRARMRQLESGQVLEVVSDDPAAREGVPAWSRLTGNPLLATATDGDRLHFSIRKK
jgi:tRNA 2-thiouridine synthesizing protein A